MAPAIERELIVAADFVMAATEQIVAADPRSLVLAGGTTPMAVYERLATSELPWPEIDVFFGDERCVPPEHPASNFGMAWDSLLSKVPARVHRMTCDAEAYEREIEAVMGRGLPVFDLVILGLGADGHTASLFAGDPAPAIEDRWVTRVERPDHPRLTLTLPVLSAAKMVLFLVAGAEKRQALRDLLAGAEIPAARVAAKRVVIVADEAAASS
ncbi:MAG: 6-phosphogluconolactonase [Dehalococcoidia bacterium]|nr:6-phosphogluconolactonase [Dehalococcoidia bacterium]